MIELKQHNDSQLLTEYGAYRRVTKSGAMDFVYLSGKIISMSDGYAYKELRVMIICFSGSICLGLNSSSNLYILKNNLSKDSVFGTKVSLCLMDTEIRKLLVLPDYIESVANSIKFAKFMDI